MHILIYNLRNFERHDPIIFYTLSHCINYCLIVGIIGGFGSGIPEENPRVSGLAESDEELSPTPRAQPTLRGVKRTQITSSEYFSTMLELERRKVVAFEKFVDLLQHFFESQTHHGDVMVEAAQQ